MIEPPPQTARAPDPLRYPANTTILILLLSIAVVAATSFIANTLAIASAMTPSTCPVF